MRKIFSYITIVALFFAGSTSANATPEPQIKPSVNNYSKQIIDINPDSLTASNAYNAESQSLEKAKVSSLASAPANFYNIHTTATYATVGWDAPLDNGGETITGYHVGVGVQRVGAPLSYQYFDTVNDYIGITGFTENTTYYFTVQAINNSGYGSTIESTVTTPVANSVPTETLSLSEDSVTDSSVSISWFIPQFSGTDLNNYVVAYSTDNVNWTNTNINSLYLSKESYTISGLTSGTKYYIKTAGVNSNGQGAWSSTVTSTTAGVAPVNPDAPAGLSVVSFNQQAVVLSWSAPANDGGSPITDYIVQYKSAGATTWNAWNDGGSNNTTVTVNGLWGGTKYSFRVAAINSVGVSSYTDVIYQMTAPKTVPAAPAGLKLIDGYKTSFMISWKPPVNNGGAGIKDYIVQYKLSSESTWTTLNDGISVSTSAKILNTTNGKTYNYRIAAVNSVGQGSFSLVNYATITAPAPPTSLAYSSLNYDSVSVSYTPTFNNYKPQVRDSIIEYRKKGSPTWVIFNDGSGVTSQTKITGLSSDTTYEIRVASSNTSGWGAFTLPIEIYTPVKLSSEPPTNIKSLNTTYNSVLIAWDDSTSQNITDYLVDYSTDGISWVSYDEGSSKTSVSLIKGLTSNTAYKFRVSTVANGLTSAYSDIFTVTTDSMMSPPLSPNNLTVSNLLSDSASVAWEHNENQNSIISTYRVGISLDNISWTYTTFNNVTNKVNITVLQPNTTYWVSVEAVNSNGSSAPVVISFTTTS